LKYAKIGFTGFSQAENSSVVVPANETLLQRVYVLSAKGTPAATSDRTEFDLWIKDLDLGEEKRIPVGEF